MRVILQTFAILMLVILTLPEIHVILAIFARVAYISCHDFEVMSWDDWDKTSLLDDVVLSGVLSCQGLCF